MTIKRKNVLVGGGVEAEADTTDSVDTGGYSDSVSTEGGAITAKFSNNSSMKANSGLRLGTTQIKVNSTGGGFVSGSVISPNLLTNPQNLEDVDEDSFTGPDIFNPSGAIILTTVDYGEIQTSQIRIKWLVATNATTTLTVQYSEDNSTWTSAFTSVSTLGNTIIDQTDPTYKTFRYLRVSFTRSTSTSYPFQFYVLGAVGSDGFLITFNIRSSITANAADGTILATTGVPANGETTLDDDVYLVVNGGYLTLELVSFPAELSSATISLSDITSILENS